MNSGASIYIKILNNIKLIHLFNKYLLSVYHVPGIMLDTRDTGKSEADRVTSWCLHPGRKHRKGTSKQKTI